MAEEGEGGRGGGGRGGEGGAAAEETKQETRKRRVRTDEKLNGWTTARRWERPLVIMGDGGHKSIPVSYLLIFSFDSPPKGRFRQQLEHERHHSNI